MHRYRKYAFLFCLAATVLFLVLVHWAMYIYQGGTIHEPGLDAYSFNYNFFSDLGRRRTPGGHSNFPTNLIFKAALTLTGGCIVLFFSALPGIFKNHIAKGMAVLAALLGMVAGCCYVGIGWVPYDWSYGGHHLFVRVGFISFLLMSWAFAAGIFLEKGYPKRYAWALLIFSVILFSQLWLLSNGERSWRSNDALFRQATAQKVVVYAEILVMIFQTVGALGQLRRVRQTH